MRLTLWGVMIASLIGLIAWSSPESAFSPGHVSQGHVKISSQCGQCHAPLRGPVAERCRVCHPAGEVDGRLRPTKPSAAIHEQLAEVDCRHCHTDHKGRDRAAATPRFDHALLPSGARCIECHAKPEDVRHQPFQQPCAACHTTSGWKPATFDHRGEIGPCTGCHTAPQDTLHRQLTGDCKQCHRTDAWKPADFQHDRWFRFDREHPPECARCHPTPDYREYTCYGCHEHTPAKLRGEHAEEGIRDFTECARCHPSADEDAATRRPREGTGRAIDPPAGWAPPPDPARPGGPSGGGDDSG